MRCPPHWTVSFAFSSLNFENVTEEQLPATTPEAASHAAPESSFVHPTSIQSNISTQYGPHMLATHPE